MNDNHNDLSPDSSQQRFVDASLEEYARLQRGDDTAFLDDMEKVLDEVDYETDVKNEKVEVMPRTRQKKTLWFSAAAAVAIVAILIPVLSSVQENPQETGEPMIVAKVVNPPEDGLLVSEILSKRTLPVSNSTALPVDIKVEPPATPVPVANLAAVEKLGSQENKEGEVRRSVLVSERLKTDSEQGESFELAQVDHDPLGRGGLKGGKKDISINGKLFSPLKEKSVIGSGGYVAPTSAPSPTPVPGASGVSVGYSSDYVFKGERRKEFKQAPPSPAPVKKPVAPIRPSTTTSTLAPHIGYNGSPDSWVADGSAIVNSNANDVLYGGVSLSVNFGDPPGKDMTVAKTIAESKKGNHPMNDRTSKQPAVTTGKKATSERYGKLIDNSFASPIKEPLSTFSVDVDTASYSNVRRMINEGYSIPADSVRIEEMVNYFSYDYPQPKGEHPFAFAVETAECPWNADHQLMRVGIQGKKMNRDKRPAANLVFLLDVSGSMSRENKLPLVKKSISLLVEELTENDTISVVVYAGAEGLCLPPTKGNESEKILKVLGNLHAGGSTNGGAGIQLAYKIAEQNFKKDGINRVILCTDGDFNVGRTDQGSLVNMVEHRAKSGTFLSVMGFGSGNINDSMLEAITNKGNGNYFYIDSLKEGRKVLLQDLMSTLVTIAKDVKIQIEFNPQHVQNYRLVGYANRMLKAEDFENDKVDAGEIGAGHSVTALYEIVPAGAPPIEQQMTSLKYQKPIEPAKPKVQLVESDELCTLKLRYKLPNSDTSVPMEHPVTYKSREWENASDDFQFAAGVGLWGMLLRDSENCGQGTIEDVLQMAKEGMGEDPFGRRQEFKKLVETCEDKKLIEKPDSHSAGAKIGVKF